LWFTAFILIASWLVGVVRTPATFVHNNYFNNTKNAEVRLQIRTTKSMKAKRMTSSLSRLPFHPRSGRLMTKTNGKIETAELIAAIQDWLSKKTRWI
jgi:hypothetical protein